VPGTSAHVGTTIVPPIAELAEAAKCCRACDLWRIGTQTVFGEGNPDARLVLVGEQPGDREDLAGRPFVGPAGRVLEAALAEAEIDRAEIYVTNAVKHFKWKAKGKRRIHQRPDAAEIAACRHWLDGELAAIEPNVVVLLGAIAAQSLLGQSFRVTERRGEPIADTGFAGYVVATVHPASVVRIANRDARRLAQHQLAADLRAAAELAR
jgi:uracil-DNA glycosylase